MSDQRTAISLLPLTQPALHCLQSALFVCYPILNRLVAVDV